MECPALVVSCCQSMAHRAIRQAEAAFLCDVFDISNPIAAVDRISAEMSYLLDQLLTVPLDILRPLFETIHKAHCAASVPLLCLLSSLSESITIEPIAWFPSSFLASCLVRLACTVKSVNLSKTGAGDDCLLALVRLGSSLECLDVSETDITDSSAQCWKHFTKLCELNVSRTNVGQSSIIQIVALPSLASLKAFDISISGADLMSAITARTPSSLTWLGFCIHTANQKEEIVRVKELLMTWNEAPNLRNFRINSTTCASIHSPPARNELGLDLYQRCPHLEQAVLVDTDMFALLSPFASTSPEPWPSCFQSLTHVDLSYSNHWDVIEVSKQLLDLLAAHLPHLETLSARSRPISSDISDLSSFSKLKDLHLMIRSLADIHAWPPRLTSLQVYRRSGRFADPNTPTPFPHDDDIECFLQQIASSSLASLCKLRLAGWTFSSSVPAKRLLSLLPVVEYLELIQDMNAADFPDTVDEWKVSHPNLRSFDFSSSGLDAIPGILPHVERIETKSPLASVGESAKSRLPALRWLNCSAGAAVDWLQSPFAPSLRSLALTSNEKTINFSFLTAFAGLTSLIVEHAYFDVETGSKILAALPFLERLSLFRFQDASPFLWLKHPRLSSITLTVADEVGPASAWTVDGSTLPNLQAVHLVARLPGLSVSMLGLAHLKQLTVFAQADVHLVTCECPQLQKLDCQGCQFASLRLKQLPQLRELGFLNPDFPETGVDIGPLPALKKLKFFPSQSEIQQDLHAYLKSNIKE